MEEKNKTDIDNEVHITHIFNAPRELVFRAWTDPDQLVKWYAPYGCTIHFSKIEARNGGTFLSCISNPQFGDCWGKGVYTEVVFPERIEFSMIVSDENGNTVEPTEAGMDPDWPLETKVIITFSELDGMTRLTLHQTVSQNLAKKTGAYPSWIQMFERLEELIN